MRIGTFNTRGSKTKLDAIVREILLRKLDVCLLQEFRRLTDAQLQDFTNKTGMHLHVNIGSLGERKGIGIAIAYKTPGEIKPSLNDIDIGVSSKIKYPDISIINFYGPHDVLVRQRAITKLYTHLDCRTILGGDFNMVEGELDKWAPDTAYHSIARRFRGTEELQILQQYGNMRDYFRYENPTVREYTFVHNAGFRSRLDRFYVSVELWGTIHNYVNKPNPTSDHNLVSIDYRNNHGSTPNNKIERGQTYWKLNNRIMDHPGYKEKIMTTIKKYHHIKRNVGPIKAWRKTKEEIAIISQKFGLKLSQENKREENKLGQELARLVQSQSTGREVIDVRNKLDEMTKHRTHGALIRSKMEEGIVADIVEYKKKENRRGIINRITEVKADGQTHKDEGEILNQVNNFYQSLYTREEVDPEATTQLLHHVTNTLTDTDTDSLEDPIWEREVEKAIKESNNNKSPGPDGLTYEFYKTFESQMSEILTELYNNIHLRGRMEDGMRESYIRLIYKKGDKGELKNWRPISLSNTDYKIMSKVLTTRLNKVLPQLINEDQVCGITGRSIQRHLYLLQDLNRDEHLSRSKFNLIGIDMQKAFDRIDHRYVTQVIQKMGFDDNMKKWFKIIQTDLTAKVIVNSKLTGGIRIERGIRQGCSFSMATFILALEPLLNKIRDNPNIPGIILPGYNNINTIAYADDMTIVTKNNAGIDETFKTIDIYERASGSKINMDKCEIYPLNRSNPYMGKYKDITTDKIKLLGITFSKKNMQKLNWEPVLRKAQGDLQILRTKPAPLYIKAKIINRLILPKFYYVARIIGICKEYVKKIKSMLNIYLNAGWKELPNEVIYASVERGGLGVHDIELRTHALEVDRLTEAAKHPAERWTY